MQQRRERSRGTLLAHGTWGVLGLASCLLLATARGGHPPPLVLLPLAAAVWLVGHVAIWIVILLAARGRRFVAARRGEPAPRPAALVLALLSTGLAVAIGLVQLAVSLVLAEPYPFRLPVLWAISMVIWTVHGIGFVGVLLRKPWSRVLCAALAAAWAADLLWLVAEHMARGLPIDGGELAIAASLILVLLVLAWHLATSRRVRGYLIG